MEMRIRSLLELEAFANDFAAQLRAGDVIGLSGELGAGKTTFVQMIGKALGVRVPMTSPTFVFRKDYVLDPLSEAGKRGVQSLVHVDAYRIESGSAEDLGELDASNAITVVEWPEKIERIMPPRTRWLRIEIGTGDERVFVE